MAINAIRSRGGIVKREEFGIICGSPKRQKNHFPYESILASLIKYVIILETPDEVGYMYLDLMEIERSDEIRL